MSIYLSASNSMIAQTLLSVADVRTESFTHTIRHDSEATVLWAAYEPIISYEANCAADAEAFRTWLRFASVPYSDDEKFPSQVSVRVRAARSALHNFAPYLDEEQRRAHLKAAAQATPVKCGELSAMQVAGHVLAHASAGPHHNYIICSQQVVYSTEHASLAETLRDWLSASKVDWTSCWTQQRDGTDVLNTIVRVDDLRACVERQRPKPAPTMMSVTSPPTDPSQVVIVMQRQGDAVIASTFKYKKGKWCGQASNTKYTTEELVTDPSTAFWMVSPIQPPYKD